MSYTVPTLSIVFMALSMLAGIAIPVVLYVWLRKKYRCDHVAFFIGCAVMLLFAFVLESLAHKLILGSALGTKIMSSVWSYGLYGGFMAGLFEESGRYIAFRTVLKKKQYRDHNALMYGAGHGGFEALYLLGLTMVNNLVFAFMMNSGASAALTAGLSGDALLTVQATMAGLSQINPALFLVGVLERGAAVIAQISLSVLVWFAAKGKGKRFWFFPLAILLHMVLDTGAVIMNSYVNSILWVELAVYIFAGLCALLAVKVWKTYSSPVEAAAPQPEDAASLPETTEEEQQ